MGSHCCDGLLLQAWLVGRTVLKYLEILSQYCDIVTRIQDGHQSFVIFVVIQDGCQWYMEVDIMWDEC